MKSFPFLIVALFLGTAASNGANPNANLANLPLSFEANIGQADSTAAFIVHGQNGNMLLTPTEAQLTFRHRDSQSNSPSTLRLQLVGANFNPVLEGLNPLPGRANYLTGNDPTQWHTDAPTFAKVKYHDVYPGVDLIYYGNQQKLEYDFVIQPGSSPDSILLKFAGADKMSIDANGDLLLQEGAEIIRQHKPIVYQEINGKHKMLSGQYVLHAGMEAGFEVADYDKSRPLVIDPVLTYSATFGATGISQALAIAVDAQKNIYLTGNTSARNFPVINPAQSNFLGNLDAVVMKIDTNGMVVYATYLGGGILNNINNASSSQGIAVDRFGDAVVTGYTQVTNFPVKNPVQATFGGIIDAFVTELNPAGNNLVYSTYLGGTGFDFASGVALDTNGNAVITGNTQSTNFPTFHASQPTYGGNGDAFVAKFNTNGALIYSTFLGGSNSENNGTTNLFSFIPTELANSGGAVASDGAGFAYVTGWTYSSNFPVLNAIQSTNNSFSPGSAANAFVTKYDLAGNRVASTYFGAAFGNFGRAIAVDFNSNVYFAGNVQLGSLTVSNAFQPNYAGFGTGNGIGDGFIAALGPGGTNLIYSTYFGGSADDQINGLAVRGDGTVAVTGFTDSPDFPLMGAFQPTGYQGLFKSGDGGNTWSKTSTGLTSSTIYSIRVDPSNPANVYALVKSGGVFKSTDAGAHWSSANTGIGSISSPFVSEAATENLMIMDPSHPGTLYVAGSAGYSITTNGAATWTPITIPGGSSILCLALDSTSPLTIYAGSVSGGVYKSTDGGSTWSHSTTGLTASTTVLSLLVDPQNSSIIYAGVDGIFSQSLYKSTNGGTNWTLASTGLPSAPVPTIAINPSGPGIYAISGNFFTSSALCLTTNQGTNWTQPLSAQNFKFPALAMLSASSSSSPVLAISQSGNNDVLSWPAPSTGFVLQYSASLGPTNWQNVVQQPGTLNGNNVLTNPMSGGQGFYRLIGTNSSSSSSPLIVIGTDSSSEDGLIKTTDGGNTLSVIGKFGGDTVNCVAFGGANPSVLYAGLNSGRDSFLSVFSPAGQLESSSFLGGMGNDQGNALAFMSQTDVTVAGSTFSSDFPSAGGGSHGPQPQTTIGSATTGGNISVSTGEHVCDCPTNETIHIDGVTGEELDSPFIPVPFGSTLTQKGSKPAGMNFDPIPNIGGFSPVGDGGGMHGIPTESSTSTYTVTVDDGECPPVTYTYIFDILPSVGNLTR